MNEVNRADLAARLPRIAAEESGHPTLRREGARPVLTHEFPGIDVVELRLQCLRLAAQSGESREATLARANAYNVFVWSGHDIANPTGSR